MVNPNSQLEAALAQFAAQSGTTPAQEAQLRAAVVADADRLNRQAVSHQLKGFELEVPGGSLDLIDRDDRPLRKVKTSIARWLALSCVLAMTACATAAERHPPANETTTMHPVATTQNPTLSAEEIGKRFLKLIEGLESRQDLSLEQVQSVMGLNLAPVEDGSLFGHRQDLEGSWFYLFTYIPESLAAKKGVGLYFEHRSDGFSDMSAVCGLDFDDYHNALVAMGFLADPHYGEIGELRSWNYTKFKKSDGTVDMTISLVPQNVVAGQAGRVCVKSIGTLN